ncbi:MAG: ABC transporter substrate-binding protein [Acidimicrobiia bacterium]
MNTRRRTASCSVIGLVCALVFASCSGGGGSGRAAGPSGSDTCSQGALRTARKPVNITMWHQMGTNNARVFASIVDGFNRSQGDVHVKLVDQSAEISALPKFRAGLTTGDIPDVIQLEETALQAMIDSKATMPVQACIDSDHYSLADFLPKVTGYYTVKGVLRSMPYNPSNPILFYNKNAFARAGLDPNRPPQTLEEVRADSQKIVASGAAKHGIALRIAEFFTEFWSSKNGQVYANNGNGRLRRATEARLDNPTQRTVWTWWHDMVRDGLALNTGRDPGGATHLLAIGTGDAAMTIEGSGVLGPIVKVLESGQYPGVKVGTGPLPGVHAGGGVQTAEGSLYIVKRSDAAHRAAAWRFIKYLVAPEQMIRLHLETGYVPIRKSVAASPAVQARWAQEPAYRTSYDQLLSGPTTLATTGPVIGNFAGVREAVVDGITSMLTQGVSPRAALAATQRKADAAIRDYNERVSG